MMQSTATPKRIVDGNYPALSYDNYDFTATKTVLLKSVEIEDTGVSVEFQSSGETCDRFYIYQKYDAPAWKLDAVVVKQDGNPVYTWRLAYEDKDHLRFLAEVEQPDGGTYAFHYLHPGTGYESPYTAEADEYGYSREMSGQPYSLMTQVDYPTGGHTAFEYEHHTFGKRVHTVVTANSCTSSLKDWDEARPEDGNTLRGFRIRKISDHDGRNASPVQTRTYAYVPGKFSVTGSSSGILLKTRPVDATDSRYPVLLTPVWNKNYNIDEPYIGYSHVVETFGDGGYTQYSFSDYVSCPDNAGVNYRWLSGAGPSNPLVFAFSHVTLAASSWDKRGLLVKKQAYDARNNLCLLQEYNYENAGTFLTPMPPAGQEEEPYAVCFRSLDGGGMAMKLYMQDHPVVREKETEYGDGDGYLYTLTEHAYNADGFLERTDKGTSDGDTLRTEYAYPSASKYPQLLPLNVKGRVVEKRQYRSGQLLWTEEYRPKVLEGGGVVTESTWRRKGKGSASWQTQCYQHDGYGNPVDIREREGVDRIVIWGYAGRYPVAEITGASYAEVKEALGGTAPESLSSAATPDMARLDALRSALPQALVTTYTHKPLVGVASVTDANGTTTTYTYNGKGELVRAADDDGRTVTEYGKHYRK